MHFKKPKPLYRPAPPAPAVHPDILLTANALVLTTESKEKFVALYQEYLDEYQPQGPTLRDLVEEMVAAKWRERRCALIETAILNVTMDRMADKVAEEFANIPHAIRTALAYLHQHGAEGVLARITRDEARYIHIWHRALKLLNEVQKEKIRNEPQKDLTPIISITREQPKRSSAPVPVPQQTTPPAPREPVRSDIAENPHG